MVNLQKPSAEKSFDQEAYHQESLRRIRQDGQALADKINTAFGKLSSADAAAHEDRMNVLRVMKPSDVVQLTESAPDGQALRDTLERIGKTYAMEVATSEGNGKFARRMREKAKQVMGELATQPTR